MKNKYKDLLMRAAPGLHEKIFELVQDHRVLGDVIDLGAGQGALTERFSDAVYRVTAVDINSADFKSTNFFRRFTLDFNNKAEVQAFMQMHASHYDVVLGIEVIEHLEDPWSYVRQLTDLAKPGGLVVISTPNPSSWHSRLRFLFSGVYDEFSEISQEGHINPVTPWELAMIMKKSNLSSIKIHSAGLNYDKPTLFQWLVYAACLILRPFQKGLLDGYCIVATGLVK